MNRTQPAIRDKELASWLPARLGIMAVVGTGLRRDTELAVREWRRVREAKEELSIGTEESAVSPATGIVLR